MSAAAGALRYLLIRSTVNRSRRQLRRLRAPRYALGMIAAVLYLWFVFGGGSLAGRSQTGPPRVIPLAYETVLALSIGWLWLFGPAEPALAFTGADVQLLFPAPVTRRTLVKFKIAQAQLAILLSAFIWLVLLARRTAIPAPLRAFALWSLFTTLYLHRVGASFVRLEAARRGRRGLRRVWLPLAIAGTALAVALWSVVRAMPSIVTALENGTLGAAMLALRRTEAISVILWPFHALVAPVFARSTDAFVETIGWSVVLLLAHYLWVIRSGVSFEEAAMQRSERIAAQRAARRTGRWAPIKVSRVWLPLAPTGRRETAFLWKNAIAFQRITPFGRIVLVAVVVAGTIAVMMPGRPFDWTVVASLSLTLAAVLTIFGPIYVRTDLQQDMLMLPLLRSYPLTGRAIVTAEIASTVAMLAVVQGVLLVVGFPELVRYVGSRVALPAAAAGAIVIPTVTALRVAVANGWVVLLPGWVHLGPGRAGGIETLGQNMLTVIGSSIAHLLLLILPASFAVAAVGLSVRWLENWSWTVGALAAAVIAILELWAVTHWLGAVLQRTDPQDVEAEAA